MWLDNLGIVIRVEDVYKKLAIQTGVNVEALDANAKKLAFFNEVMRVASTKSNELGDQTKSLGENWDTVMAKIKN